MLTYVSSSPSALIESIARESPGSKFSSDLTKLIELFRRFRITRSSAAFTESAEHPARNLQPHHLNKSSTQQQCSSVIKCRCCGALRESYSSNKTLLLGHNDFREEGAVALAAALHHLPELIVLSLGRNDIGAAGAAALAPYFSGAKSCRRNPSGFLPDPHLSPTNP
jgi:hypothetical protein